MQHWSIVIECSQSTGFYKFVLGQAYFEPNQQGLFTNHTTCQAQFTDSTFMECKRHFVFKRTSFFQLHKGASYSIGSAKCLLSFPPSNQLFKYQ